MRMRIFVPIGCTVLYLRDQGCQEVYVSSAGDTVAFVLEGQGKNASCIDSWGIEAGNLYTYTVFCSVVKGQVSQFYFYIPCVVFVPFSNPP